MVATLDASAGGASTAAPRVLLRQDGAVWRVRAGERSDATVDYGAFVGSWPSSAHIVSRPGAAVPIDVRMNIDQIFVNTDIADRAFAADVPAGFAPMTLDELRSIGPLGERTTSAGGAA